MITSLRFKALDPKGRPNFNMLQNFRSAEAHIHYYAFDMELAPFVHAIGELLKKS